MALRYTTEVRHEGLGKYRVISGTDRALVEAKAQEQLFEWRRKYAEVLAKQKAVAAREAARQETESKLYEAKEGTAEAQQAIEKVKSLLRSALNTRCAISWGKLKKHEPFTKPEPKPPVYLEFPREPEPSDAVYRPRLNLLDKLIKSRKEQKEQVANEVFTRAHVAWVTAVEATRVENDRRYAQNVAEVEQWNREAQAYQEELAKKDAAIDDLKAKYEALQPDAVEDYCEMVLARSEYPDDFPQDFDLEYNPETKILIVEYALPAPEHLPRLKEVKYVKSKDDFADTFLSENELNNLYDDALYRICLRSLHELFKADVVNALAAISFNGWVNSVDRATGKEVNACVLSIQVKKDEFQAINLENVEPKTCFKALRGVGSSKLHSLTPVAPVLAISREDKRFVAPRDVENQLNEGMNLAAMDWEDFEHLIRQLFEQEFKQAGGEVKITQASRDHGVDAVAFDPDVIRGGKTVIQAKRYTNTVGVSAVRDLYGTVINEGASKGILVTTSDYGPDSYEFAKGKPLVLLNGANLLNLLEKHGHKAKIDLKEAKKIIAEQEKAKES